MLHHGIAQEQVRSQWKESTQEQYAAYVYEFGYPPKQPNHLIQFGKKNGVKITWAECKKIITKAPDTSDYVPPPKTNKKKSNQPEQLKKMQSMETAKRYSTNNLVIDQNKLWSNDNNKVGKHDSAKKYEYLLSQLVGMGWDRDLSLAALKASNGNLHLALESLMSGVAKTDVPRKQKHGQMQQNSTNQNQQSNANQKARVNRASSSMMRVKEAVKTAYISYEISKGKPPSDVQAFVFYCKNRRNIKKANWTVCQTVIEEEKKKIKKFTPQTSQNENNMFESSQVSNNYDAQQQQQNAFAHQQMSNSYNPPANGNNFQQQQQQQTQQISASQTSNNNNAFNKLLSGHGSIKHRLQAMDQIYASLNTLDIAEDSGKVLMHAYAEQILHEDYIYHDYAVRIKAIEQISDVFIFCLNTLPSNQTADFVEMSLPEIMDNLYKLLDDNRARKFHDMAKECLRKIIAAIIGKNDILLMIALCAMLNEKMNIENVTQAHGRFFAAKQLFLGIVFGQNDQLINEWFGIDISAYNNQMLKLKNNVQINANDVSQQSEWFKLLVAKQRANDHEETFKDIVIDCLSIMMLDPNGDISIIGNNLTVYFYEFDNDFPKELETEAKYRFNKWFEPKEAVNNNIYETKSREEIMRKIKKVIEKGQNDGTKRSEIESFLMEQGIHSDDIAKGYDEHYNAQQQQQQQQNGYASPQNNGYQQQYVQQNGYQSNGNQQNNYYQQQNGYSSPQQNAYQQNVQNYQQQQQHKYPQNAYQQQPVTSSNQGHNNVNYGATNYRIKQETDVNIGSIELPDL